MKFIKVLIISIFSLSIFACGETPSPNGAANGKTISEAATPVGTPMDELAIGRQIYSANCAACHKEDGTGGKIAIEGKSINPDDLTSEKIKKFDDDKIIKYIYFGVEDEGMPAFKDKIGEAQIREIVRFIRIGLQKMPEPSLIKPPG
ncbi:MAG TPA: cytochrome c [Pyrinomonadaceae bacterium]|nr:cytochrome c [Pyrinomonadaceae bacterium]